MEAVVGRRRQHVVHEGPVGERIGVSAAVEELGDVAVVVGALDRGGGNVGLGVDLIAMPEAAVGRGGDDTVVGGCADRPQSRIEFTGEELVERQPAAGHVRAAADQGLLDRVLRSVAQEGLQDVVAKRLGGVQEAAPLAGKVGQPTAKDLGVLRNRGPVDVHLLIDQPEEVRQAVTDFLCVAFLGCRGLPGRRVGLPRNPSDEVPEIVVIGRQVPRPVQRVAQFRVQVGLRALAGPAAVISAARRPGGCPSRACSGGHARCGRARSSAGAPSSNWWSGQSAPRRRLLDADE